MATIGAMKAIGAQLVMKAQTTVGADILGGAYTVADIIPIEAGSLNFTQEPNEIENRMTAGNMGRGPSALGRLVGMLECSLLFRGAGVNYSASVKPEIHNLLLAAGHSAVFDTTGGVKWTYKPTTVDELYTVYGVLPPASGTTGMSVRLIDAQVSRLTLESQAGQPLRVSVGIMGALAGTNGRADITYVPGTMSSIVPPVTKGAQFVIDDSAGYAPRIKSIGFDIGNQVQYVDSINAVGAVAGTLRMDRAPMLSIDPEADLEATSGWWAMLQAGSPLNFCTFNVGNTALNRLLFKFGANGTDRLLQLVQQNIQVRDGLMALPSRLRATISAENNDFSLVAS